MINRDVNGGGGGGGGGGAPRRAREGGRVETMFICGRKEEGRREGRKEGREEEWKVLAHSLNG